MKRLFILIAFIGLCLSLTACDNGNNLNLINRIDLSFNEDSLTMTSPNNKLEISINDLLNELEVLVTVDEPAFFHAKATIYVNNQKIDSKVITYERNRLTFKMTHPNPVDPESYVDVEVTLNPGGGLWPKNLVDTFEPTHTLTITSRNDLTGSTFSLFDNQQTQLRWFYKLFLDYNEDYDAYEVVFRDASTASVLNLSLPAYDLIIGAHLHTTDLDARETLIELASNGEIPMFVKFSQSPSSYQSGDLGVQIWTKDQLTEEVTVTYFDHVVLPVPSKPLFTFLGWSDGTQIYQSFPRYQAKDRIQKITYTAVWGSLSLTELQNVLKEIVPSVTNKDLVFIQSYSAFTLTWDSSHPDVISHDGKYKRPYQDTTVTLTITVQSEDINEHLYFETSVLGYKSLDGPIASSYIYRNFNLVNDTFFRSLDIINGAFVTAQEDGSLIGASFLANMETYILPKAREYGNWVIPSIGPDSAWSEIALSATKINQFADNIVKLINTYGFDGVDIDWETPKSGEELRYTNLMRVVYTKVKENNPNHLVTTAITGGQWQPPRYDLVHSKQYIDYINLMTYGMVSSGAQYQNALYRATPTYHNTTFNVGRTLSSCSIDESVKMFKDSYQVNYDKIIVGVAFYGIRQTRTYDSNSQTWSSWTNGGSVHYSEIASNHLKNDQYIKAYDQRAGVPYIVKTDGSEFISYDNPKSILEKSAYIIDQGLAGMMYWEHGLDTTGALLDAMRTGLMK